MEKSTEALTHDWGDITSEPDPNVDFNTTDRIRFTFTMTVPPDGWPGTPS